MGRIGLCSIMLMGLTATGAVPPHAHSADELIGTSRQDPPPNHRQEHLAALQDLWPDHWPADVETA